MRSHDRLWQSVAERVKPPWPMQDAMPCEKVLPKKQSNSDHRRTDHRGSAWGAGVTRISDAREQRWIRLLLQRMHQDRCARTVQRWWRSAAAAAVARSAAAAPCWLAATPFPSARGPRSKARGRWCKLGREGVGWMRLRRKRSSGPEKHDNEHVRGENQLRGVGHSVERASFCCLLSPLVCASPLCVLRVLWSRFASTLSLHGAPVSLCLRQRRTNGSEPAWAHAEEWRTPQRENTGERQACSMRNFSCRQTPGPLASLSCIHLPRCLTRWAHCALPRCGLHSLSKQHEAQRHTTTECTSSCFDFWSCSSCLPAACLLFLPVSVSAADRTTHPPHTA
jgi:hypothetical protein